MSYDVENVSSMAESECSQVLCINNFAWECILRPEMK